MKSTVNVGSIIAAAVMVTLTLSYENADEVAPLASAYKAARARVAVEEEGAQVASSRRFLQKFELKSFAVLAPGVKDVPPGTDIPPWAYEIDYSEIGPIVQAELKLTQVLTSFGKISHSAKAARAKADASLADSQEALLKITKNLKLLVIHYSLLCDLERLFQSVWKKGDEIMKKIEEEDIEIKKTDLNKLKAFFHFVKAKLSQIQKQKEGIEKGASAILGQDVSIKPLEFYPEDISGNWINLSEPDLSTHPAVKKISAQVKALREAYLATRALLFPDIFLAGQIKFSYAPLWPKEYVSCTLNPNCFSYGAGLGLRLNLNYFVTSQKVQEARARLEAAQRALEATVDKLKVEWLKAYSNAQGQWASYSQLTKALKYARSNVAAAMLNFDMGIVDADEIVDAYSRYIQLKAEVIKGKYNLARHLTEMWMYDGRRYLP